MPITVLESASAFDAIADEYRALLASADVHSPFVSHRWLAAWWHAHERIAGRLRVVLVRGAGGRLLAAVPLQLQRGTFGKLGVNQLGLLGGGWGPVELPAVRGESAPWLNPLLDWMFGSAGRRWDLFRFGPIEPRAAHVDALGDALTRRGVRFRASEHPAPYLPLASSWEAFLSGRSRNFRRTIKRKYQALEEAGGAEVRHTTEPTPDQLRESVYDVSTRSWQGARGLAVASSESGRAFYDAVASGRGELILELSTVHMTGRCVAYLLAVRYGRVVHAFDTGFDPAFAEQSPGLVVHFRLLESLCDGSADELDFGYDHGYKERFEPLQRTSRELLVFRSSLLAHYSQLAERAKALLGR